MTTLIQSVTSNAIPFNDASQCYRRIGPTRLKLMNEITDAYEAFNEAEAYLKLVDVKNVEQVKQALSTLVEACGAYADNLGWNL